MPDRTAYFADLRARGEPVPQMHPDDYSEKVLSIVRRLEAHQESDSPPSALLDLLAKPAA